MACEYRARVLGMVGSTNTYYRHSCEGLTFTFFIFFKSVSLLKNRWIKGMNVKEIVSIAVLVIIVIVASFGVMLAFFKVVDDPARAYAGGISLGLKDNNTSRIEEILLVNLPVSYTVRYDVLPPRAYTVIPSSKLNSLEETLFRNERIGTIAIKQDDGDIYAFVRLLDDTDHADTNKLQEHPDKYSLAVKKVNRIYVRFENDVQCREIEHTLNLLKKENNVISAYPDLVEG